MKGSRTRKHEVNRKYVEGGTYIEHCRKPVGLSISRRPVVPRDGLTSFEDLLGVSKQPAWGRWSRKFLEWRLGVTNLDLDECDDDCDGKRRSKS